MSLKSENHRIGSFIKYNPIIKIILSEKLGISLYEFNRKLKAKTTKGAFSEKELSAIINKIMEILSVRIQDILQSRKPNFTKTYPEKFQNSLEKSKGVVSPEARKKEFPGGSFANSGTNNPEVFRPFGLQHIWFDCDEEGNPLTNK